jgi:hypothetical protein
VTAPGAKFRGQCPICFAVQEFSASGMPSAVTCVCGTKLIALRAANLSEIPVHCASCRESYLVEPEDIGELLECECGAEIEVLETILRAPMKTADDFSIENQPLVRNDTSGPSAKSSTLPFSIVESAPPQAKVPRTKTSKKSGSNEIARPSERKKNRPFIAGVAGVLAFLLVSIAAFTFSRLKSNDADAQSNTKKQSVLATKPAQPLSEQKIPAGMMAKLLAEVPIPQSGKETTSGPASNGQGNPTKSTKQADGKSAPVRSPYGGTVAKRKMEFPDPVAPRQRVSEVPVERTHRLLSSAYQDMFNSYEKLNAIDGKAKESLSDEYRKALGETLYLCRHALPIAQRDQDAKKANELTYLLAYLAYTAGHLTEASIYGEAAARWGDPKDKATREAAMIAISACQESNASQADFGTRVGELDQMRIVAELLDQRWPDDPQREAIWMHLGQSYLAFGKPLPAANAFLKIAKKSEQFDDAQLAAGNAYWSHFLDRASEETPNPKEMVLLLKSAGKHLQAAVQSMQSGETKPTTNLISAKILLAKISDRLGDAKAAIDWIESEPMAVTTSITTQSGSQTTPASGKKSTVLVDTSVAVAAFDTLYRIKSSKQDWGGAYQALVRLEKYSDSELGLNYAAVTHDYIGQLTQQARVTESEVALLKRMTDSLKSHDAKRLEAMQGWIGQTWATLGKKAESESLSSTCFELAESAFAEASKQPEFPEESRLSMELLRADLLQQSGDLAQSLAIMGEVLRKTPNAVNLQIRAAEMRQELAFQQDKVGGLLDAINGSASESADGQPSPIWGWVKLSNTLQQLSSSEKGTDEHRRMSHEANYHLARCQWLLAKVTKDPSHRDSQLSKLKTQLKRRLALSGPDDGSRDIWQKGLESLLAKIE